MGHPMLHNGIKPNGERAENVATGRGPLACIINSEIGAVLAVMRRNVRWGVQYVSDEDQLDHSLIRSLKALRKQIFSRLYHWETIDPVVYLQPFLDVIRSDETGAPITGVALSSVYKIVSLDVFDLNTANVQEAMHLVVDAVTSCRFEVTDPASEEVVLMKILQVLLACMKSKASVMMSNQHVCNIVNTCFRVVHQAGTKGELLQRIARHAMHEVVRCIFSYLSNIDTTDLTSVNRGSSTKVEFMVNAHDNSCDFGVKPSENINGGSELDLQLSHSASVSGASTSLAADVMDKTTIESDKGKETMANDMHQPAEGYGIPCMVEILHFFCSLLNISEHLGTGPKSNTIAFDEDVPLFVLGLINSAIELGGVSFSRHPSLLSLIQDELFGNLMHFGLSMSPLILSMVSSVVLNLYYHMRAELKLQLEAFFSCVILRLAQSRYGASYQQQEVGMEALVDFCRQKNFMVEMYANFDCDMSCSNVFEDLANLLSKSAFPVNGPLSSMHVLALDGLIAVIQGMAERIGNDSIGFRQAPVDDQEYTSFWSVKCDNYNDPSHWVPFVLQRKHIKKKLMIGVDHFNRETKKGLQFLQGTHLLPDPLDAQSVACFFRYAAGLDKNLVGDFLGNHDEFCVQVLHEFARTFDFRDMNLDTALRLFLETFRLPGESQKIQRVLEAFSERYFEQSPQILANKDAALLLSYSIIMLNTDLHNAQVKRKMTEEDFIRNNRRINGGNDLPREFLSELYHSICKNEIRTTPEQSTGLPEMTASRWINLIYKSRKTAPYIVPDSRAFLDQDMFSIISGPTIAAISVVLDHAEHEDVFRECFDGFLAVAKISSCYHLVDVLDEVVVSLCKFTSLMNSSHYEDSILAFGEDTKAKMATVTVFTIANMYGDFICRGWKTIVECILSLHRLGLLPACVAGVGSDDLELSADLQKGKTVANSVSQTTSGGTPKRTSSLMGRFSQLLYLDTEEPKLPPSEDEIAAHQSCLQTVQECQIDNVFTESKFLQADSLKNLVGALTAVAGRPQKGYYSLEDENTVVLCLELLIAITLNNRDRIALIWKDVYEHISSVVQSSVMPGAPVEKAVFGLLRICHRLLPYKENLAEELLRSLQLILKLDARVADAYCEQITVEVNRLVKANATHIRSQAGWRTIASLLSITARHPEAAEAGFDTLSFIMSDGAHLLPANYMLCIDASRQFAESRLGQLERSMRSVDLMAGSVACLAQWSIEAQKALTEVDAAKMLQDIGEMWLRLVQGLKKVCLDQREEVRNHCLLSLQRCLTGVDVSQLLCSVWLQCFDLVIFPLLDDLLEIAQDRSQKEYRSMEGTLYLAMKLMSKAFLYSLPHILQSTNICNLWGGVLIRMENYMKVKIRGKRSEKLHEVVPELLKNSLLVMRTEGLLVRAGDQSGGNLWEMTWLHVNKIAPSLWAEVFPDREPQQSQQKQGEAEPDEKDAVTSPGIVAS
ncbi:Sec7 domain [Dillenia turbinata]|uniref:Sec7 domain n=1 Tax=Dillenia turbinata TaxID=194707 RepID=A0AAN8UIS4_9MAGN